MLAGPGAMSGAMLIVPDIGGPLIRRELLGENVQHLIVPGTREALGAAIKAVMAEGVDREANHERVARSHGWATAADRIAAELVA